MRINHTSTCHSLIDSHGENEEYARINNLSTSKLGSTQLKANLLRPHPMQA